MVGEYNSRLGLEITLYREKFRTSSWSIFFIYSEFKYDSLFYLERIETIEWEIEKMLMVSLLSFFHDVFTFFFFVIPSISAF